MTTRKTGSCGSVYCPVCHRRGQLKLERSNLDYNTLFFRVHHWKGSGNNHTKPFDYACYLGVATEDLAKRLFTLNHREKILIEVLENERNRNS